MSGDTPATRAPGLDLLRAAAILLVMVYHHRVFVSAQPDLGWASTHGWVGVDLFFVLSGYLISQQLFAGLAQGQRLSVTAFWLRRAGRTWPAFAVVLLAFQLWPAALGGRPEVPWWRFATFTQNFGLLPGTAFSHAWSLCIEEQFYAVLPLAVLAALRWRGPVHRAWGLLVVLTALGIVARAVLWGRYGSEATGDTDGYYPWIYYATLCRFDEFLPGVGLALLQHAHPQAWQRLMAQGHRLALAAALALTTMGWATATHFYHPATGWGFWMTTLGYSAWAWAFALLLAAALTPGSLLGRPVPGAATLALLAYPLYLVHKPVAQVLRAHWPAGAEAPVLLALACAGASLAVALVLHRWVERPGMAWRDRHAPSLFQPPRFQSWLTTTPTAPTSK